MRKPHTKILTLSGLGIGVLLFLAINMLSSAALNTLRFDLTQSKLYTLSEGTKKIVEQIDEPIILRFYYSKQLGPGLVQIDNYARRVETLLQQLARQSKGKLILQAIDPEPFSAEEDLAISYGMQAVPLNNQGQLFYFGLVGTNQFGDERLISFFQISREAFLEYDITQLIYQLNDPTQATVGVLSSLPIQGNFASTFFGGDASPWGVWDMMEPLFNLQLLDFEVTTIPDNIDVLMLIKPTNLSATTTYAIDQFVLKGGYVLAFFDAYTQQAGHTSATDMSHINQLLNSWGLQLDGQHVIADISFGKQVQSEQDGRPILVEYPLWMDIPLDHLNSDDPVTGQLEVLTLAAPSLLKQLPTINLQITPLVSTSHQAMLIDINTIESINQDPQALIRDFQATDISYLLAARITGTIRSAFPEGPPPIVDETQGSSEIAPNIEATHLNESMVDANIIVMGNSEMLEDRFWLQKQNFFGQSIAIPYASNGNFVVNALDNLSGNSDLISIRSKGDFTRPFTRIREIQQNAEARYRETEQILLTQLEETENNLNALGDQEVIGDQLILSESQRQTLEEFRVQQITIRAELREVQYALQSDINQLITRIKVIDIGLMPLIVGLSGISLGIYRKRKRKNALKNSRNTSEH